MMVRCMHPSGRAELDADEAEWKCDDKALEARLNAGLEATLASMHGYDPAPHVQIAQIQIEAEGGSVIDWDPYEDEDEDEAPKYPY